MKLLLFKIIFICNINYGRNRILFTFMRPTSVSFDLGLQNIWASPLAMCSMNIEKANTL